MLLDAVRDAAGDEHLKVILETGELVEPHLIRAAAELAIDHGADFVKTSTGKTAVSATHDAVRTMLDVVAGRRTPRSASSRRVESARSTTRSATSRSPTR